MDKDIHTYAGPVCIRGEESMKALVFGSLNIDRTYRVSHIAAEGETVSACKLELFCGGKGLNQAVALSRAGADTWFAGAVGEDGDALLDMLRSNGINDTHVLQLDGPSGHAVIQVDEQGRNSIFILAGSNGRITERQVAESLADFSTGDVILLQNEINMTERIIAAAHEKGMTVVYNPSPVNEHTAVDFNMVDYLFVNKTEGMSITGKNTPERIVHALRETYPGLRVIFTAGEDGSCYDGPDGRCACGIHKVNTVDTTAAGDTFTGFFIQSIMSGKPPAEALKIAAVASGISVSRSGAAPSIPMMSEVERTEFHGCESKDNADD